MRYAYKIAASLLSFKRVDANWRDNASLYSYKFSQSFSCQHQTIITTKSHRPLHSYIAILTELKGPFELHSKTYFSLSRNILIWHLEVGTLRQPVWLLPLRLSLADINVGLGGHSSQYMSSQTAKESFPVLMPTCSCSSPGKLQIDGKRIMIG